jgi:hypothetical protein
MNEYVLEHKGYYIKPDKVNPTCYVVATVGQGGKIPDCLNGMFTTKLYAKEQIDWYLENKPSKGRENEKDNTSRSK